MPKFLLVLFFSSSIVFACPRMTGIYTCIGYEDPFPLEITQRVENNVTIFKFKKGGEETTHIADGIFRPHTARYGDQEIHGKIATKCLNNGIEIKFLAKFEDMDIDYTDGYTTGQNGGLIEEIITKLNGQLYSNEKYRCTPNN